MFLLAISDLSVVLIESRSWWILAVLVDFFGSCLRFFFFGLSSGGRRSLSGVSLRRHCKSCDGGLEPVYFTRFRFGFDRVLFGFQVAPFIAGGSSSLLRRRCLFGRVVFFCLFLFCFVGVQSFALLCCGYVSGLCSVKGLGSRLF